MIMSLGHGDQTFWPVYITIGNLDVKIKRPQKWPRMLLLSFILIIHEWLKDANNKNKDLKTKIYHITLKTIL